MSFYFIKVEIFLKQREVGFLSPSKIISTLLLYCDLSEGLIVLRHKGLTINWKTDFSSYILILQQVTYPFQYIQDREIQCHDVEGVPLANLKCFKQGKWN